MVFAGRGGGGGNEKLEILWHSEKKNFFIHSALTYLTLWKNKLFSKWGGLFVKQIYLYSIHYGYVI